MIGTLDPDCEIGNVVQQAYDNAKFLCEQVHRSARGRIITGSQSYDFDL
jgi:hypothetical protein